ncbi:MAG TPA: YjbF family lipoprotein [Nevskiales bacterium]|nr:YjbF family lipoprotein [Nevskiales bacterium]
MTTATTALCTRRGFLLALASAALAGCARGRPLAGTAGAVAGGGTTRYPFSRADIEALRVPCIGVTVGETLPGVMFLTRYEADHALRWESSNRISLVTRRGRIVATHGLRRDLAATRFATEDPLLESAPPARAGLTRQVDLVPGDHRDVVYRSTLEAVGEEFVTVLERTHRTVRITEVLTVRRWQWRALNTYWLEPDSGTVIRSIQHLAPDSPPIVIDHFGVPA